MRLLKLESFEKETSMTKTKSFFAVLSVALLLAASDARAAFTYSTAVTTGNAGSPPTVTTAPGVVNSRNFGLSSYLLNGQTSTGVLTGTQGINIVQTSQVSTQSPATTDTTSFPVSLAVTITNTTDGSGVITVAGVINVSRSDSGGALSSFNLTSILPSSITLGAFTYDLSAPVYTFPTIGVTPANGGISLTISERVVPEPASLVMMGTSVLALGGLTVIRRRRQS
jgi:hypothetical protein